jgi:hypothetical protein
MTSLYISSLTRHLPRLRRQADFYTKRWLSVQQRFWGRSQWVLAIDSDVMAVNLSRSLDAFLEMPQDLLLTVRVGEDCCQSGLESRAP